MLSPRSIRDFRLVFRFRFFFGSFVAAMAFGPVRMIRDGSYTFAPCEGVPVRGRICPVFPMSNELVISGVMAA